ncbi:autotransporter family protein [Pseudomonas mangrovi]|uniref:Autotransporter domain-containing protein n=1 Tax=Pseudomonas mangrovi TaxID=2161748 RepID=A0A2T5P9U4_9PSED|nr:autotransporter outer membrane beta-barrel domain-containing protein [Pseudomonas mangrovi]PTU74485.1 autotransporter domain-containing protein [Pseudomonas mangrovi]
MASHLLSKSLIALSVLAAHAHLSAQTIDLGGAPLNINTPYLEQLTVTGTYNFAAPIPAFVGITLANGASLPAGLTLDATLSIQTTGLAFGFYSHPGFSVPLDGDLINQGTLQASGATNAAAMMLNPARVTGSVINEGVLRATTTGSDPAHGAAGLQVITSQATSGTVGGNVENRGEIEVNGFNSSGLLITGDATIGGSLLNSGQIDINGAGSRGMAAAGSAPGTLQVNGSVENSGDIRVTSAGSPSRSASMLVFNTEVLGAVRNLGTLEGSGGERMGGISIVSSQVTSVSNGATGVIDNSAASTSGIYFEASQASGLVSNQGKIEVTGSDAFTGAGTGSGGMSIVDSQLDAGLSNSGEIIGRGANPLSGVAGMSLLGSSASFLHNTGSLDLAGFESSGIYLYDSQVNGSVLNSGDIKVVSDASAYPAAGIVAVGSTVVGGVSNTGTVDVSGVGASGVALRNGTVSSLSNSGSINAAAGAGVYLDGVTLAALTNTGSIVGGTYGIHRTGSAFGLQINHDGGLIEGSTAAILAENASLNWTAGTIRGDLEGLYVVNVLGDVVFDGAYIRTQEVEISGASGGQPAGRLALQRAHTQIDGGLFLGTGTSVDMLISTAQTNPNQAILAVSGQAEFLAGSQLRLSASADDFSANGAQYTLISAGSILDGGLGVVSNSALLNVDSFNVDAAGSRTVTAVVSRKSAGEIEQVLDQAGASGNGISAALPFTTSVLSQLDSSDPLFQAFANASPEELAALAEQLTPEVNGGATQAAMGSQSLVNGVTSSRTGGGGKGMSSGDVLQQTGVWLLGLGSNADQDRRNGIAGFDAETRGFAIGADGKLNPQTTIGLAYANLQTEVKSQTGNTSDVDGHAFTLYGGYEESGYFLDGSLTYGINDNSAKRYVAGTRVKGDFDSELFGINLLAGYGLQLNSEWLFEPRIAARYSRLDIDSYSEKGSAAALQVGAQRYEVAELGAGVRLAGNFALGQGNLQPELRVMGYHDFIADQASSTSAFLLGGSPFVTTGAKPARNSYEAGVGLNYHLGALSMGVSYDYLGKQDFSADTLQASVRYNF